MVKVRSDGRRREKKGENKHVYTERDMLMNCVWGMGAGGLRLKRKKIKHAPMLSSLRNETL